VAGGISLNQEEVRFIGTAETCALTPETKSRQSHWFDEMRVDAYNAALTHGIAHPGDRMKYMSPGSPGGVATHCFLFGAPLML
jgi:hypothetical protein